MPDNIKLSIQYLLAEKLGPGLKIEEISELSGGSINEAARIKTNKGIFFAKCNESKKFPGMMAAEVKGLELLRNANAISIPEVIAQKTISNTQYLILEYINGPSTKKDLWEDFGRSLARLHKHSAEKFGLDHPNYIGSLPQNNRQHDKWPEFFILERLEPQIKMAVDGKQISRNVISQFGKLFSSLNTIFSQEKPSLLHGDLWSGNFLTGSNGQPCIIDPAVYYGHREMDIAMTKLFGGFSPGFYEGYLSEFPLEKGWEKRAEVCNLYPLMVHVNLFGGSYVDQVESTLKRY